MNVLQGFYTKTLIHRLRMTCSVIVIYVFAIGILYVQANQNKNLCKGRYFFCSAIYNVCSVLKIRELNLDDYSF